MRALSPIPAMPAGRLSLPFPSPPRRSTALLLSPASSGGGSPPHASSAPPPSPPLYIYPSTRFLPSLQAAGSPPLSPSLSYPLILSLSSLPISLLSLSFPYDFSSSGIALCSPATRHTLNLHPPEPLPRRTGARREDAAQEGESHIPLACLRLPRLATLASSPAPPPHPHRPQWRVRILSIHEQAGSQPGRARAGEERRRKETVRACSSHARRPHPQ